MSRATISRMTTGVVLLMLLGMSGCYFETYSERKTQVRIEGVPPSFFMTGSGNLGQFTVFALDGSIVWEIHYENWRTSPPVEKLRVIQFGVAPEGCKQIVPASGAPPADLVPGEPYRFQVVTTDAPGAGGMFEIVDGKIVFVDIGN